MGGNAGPERGVRVELGNRLVPAGIAVDHHHVRCGEIDNAVAVYVLGFGAGSI